MAHYVVTGRQLVSTTIAIAVFLTICVWFGSVVVSYLETPEVHTNPDGQCIKVVNFKNGDGYTCQDKDVVLRKYKTVVAQ
jgi:hypothetical protein